MTALDAAALAKLLDVHPLPAPPGEQGCWTEDENGMVCLHRKDGTPVMTMRRADYDALCTYREMKES